MIEFTQVSYYTSLMALTIYYFIASFSATLPWSICDENWEGVICNDNLTGVVNGSKTLPELYYEYVVLYTVLEIHIRDVLQILICEILYTRKTVFPQYPNLDNGIGAPEWRLTLCLLASWVVILLSLIKGVKSSGKVAYFTAIFPYVVLFILLIRGATLEGAWEGIKFLLVFNIEDLLQARVSTVS